MARPSAEIEREIADTRRNLEIQVVELRRQSRIQIGRLLTVAVVLAAVAGVVGAGLLIWRMTRPMGWQERVRRRMPRAARRRLGKNVKRGKVRGSGEDRLVVVEPEEHRWERLVVNAAKAAGTAAAVAAMNRLLQTRAQGRPPSD